MKDSDFQRIAHIKTYCEDIAETINRFGKSYEIFSKDKDFFNSISMSLMQIGELSVSLSDKFKDQTKTQMQWGAIRGMRNLFAHAYAAMNKDAVWETAMNDIPGLLLFCERMIEKQGEEE